VKIFPEFQSRIRVYSLAEVFFELEKQVQKTKIKKEDKIFNEIEQALIRLRRTKGKALLQLFKEYLKAIEECEKIYNESTKEKILQITTVLAETLYPYFPNIIIDEPSPLVETEKEKIILMVGTYRGIINEEDLKKLIIEVFPELKDYIEIRDLSPDLWWKDINLTGIENKITEKVRQTLLQLRG